MATRTVSVALVADVGNYVSAMTRASASTSAVGRNAEKAGGQASRGFSLAGKGGLLLAAGAAGAALGLKSAIGAASDLNETLNKSNVIFGDNAGKIERWAQNAARDFGLSKAAALEAAASLGNMFQQLGFTGDQAASASTNVVKLAADLGSFNNLETGDVLERIQAGFRGEYDSLQLLIPNINAARVESEAMATSGKENAKQLTAQEKAAAVLAIVQRDGAAAANDFAETSTGLANSTKIAAAEFEDLKGQIGQAFLPAAQAAMGFIGQTAIPLFGDLFGVIQKVSGVIADNGEVAAALAVVLGVQLAGGLTAVVGGLRLVAGTTLVPFLSSVLGVATNLSGAFATAGRAVAGFTAAAAPLVAVGAIVYAVAKTIDFATAAGDARKEVADMWTAVDDSRGGEQMSALAGVVDQLQSKIRGLRDELPKTEGAMQGFLGPLGMLENGGTINALDEYEDALVRAEEQQKQVEHTAAVMGVQFGLTRDQVLDLASKYNIDLTSGVSNVNRLFQNFYSTEFGVKPTEATIGFATAMEGAEKAADDAKSAVDSFKLSLDILTGANVSMIEVESQLQESLAAGTDAMDKMGGAVLQANGQLNLQSENGRAASDVLLGVRDSGNQLIATMLQQGATSEQVQAKDAQLRAAFIHTANQMGINGTAAETLANQILGIPSSRKTAITADTSQAVAAVNGLVDKIKNAGGRVIYTGADVRNTTGVSARAAGGIIDGPGTGTSDSILGIDRRTGTPTSWVSAGEFVVNEKATNENRELIEAINAGRVSQGDLQYLAGGGRVLGGAYQVPVGLSGDMAARLEKALEAKYAGQLGAGTVGGGWTSIFNYVKARIPQARVNSAYRPGDPGYHGKGKAVDFGFGSGPGGNGSAGLASINRLLHDGIGKNLAELIYDGIGDDRADLWHGAPHTYNAGTRAEHHNHVHAAVYDQGGMLPSGGVGVNLSGQSERILNPRETSAYEAGVRSREFSGSSGGGRSSVSVAPPVVKVYLDGREWRGIARIEAEGVVVSALDSGVQRGDYNG